MGTQEATFDGVPDRPSHERGDDGRSEGRPIRERVVLGANRFLVRFGLLKRR